MHLTSTERPKKANHPKGWDAKPPTYVSSKKQGDMVAGPPGDISCITMNPTASMPGKIIFR